MFFEALVKLLVNMEDNLKVIHLKQMEVFHRLNDSKSVKLDILIKLPINKNKLCLNVNIIQIAITYLNYTAKRK